ncbi:HNH endonuclease [Streptomyces virginiae]|uniref:HNH endonuclease n=1 Tax=Streptomyces virginiae TaxID=1961 RepID=UPI0034242747
MRGTLSRATRARILAPQRCAQCGRTPLGDEVKLHVDHKIPISWGRDDDDDLQPLCEDAIWASGTSMQLTSHIPMQSETPRDTMNRTAGSASCSRP